MGNGYRFAAFNRGHINIVLPAVHIGVFSTIASKSDFGAVRRPCHAAIVEVAFGNTFGGATTNINHPDMSIFVII